MDESIELMFKKENLGSTFKALHKRSAELSAAMESFDGSDGELEIIEESKYISSLFGIFGEIQGTPATQYFSLNDDSTIDPPTQLMNSHTGSVDTAENWEAEGYDLENSDLVEVEKDESGDWQEV